MNSNVLESRLIEHCAPTLAGMKSASLFNYFHVDKKAVLEEVLSANEILNERGVYVEALLWRDNSVLIYTFRPKHLQKELEQPGAMALLEKYGYKDYDVKNCIRHLKERLQGYSVFPHEIGLFLGYPLEDVKGFIDNNGQNCKSYGLWKVYSDEEEKLKLFDKLKKCTQVYMRVFGEGRELSQMTVFT